jgi:cyclase
MLLSPAEHYTFVELDDRIFAGVARPEGHGICNSGLVDVGDDRLVFDTSTTARAADELRAAATRLLGRPPSVAANSHWHFDHALGNRQFAGLPIFGTRRTREILLETHDALMAELTREPLEKSLVEFEGRRGAMISKDARDDLEFWIQYHRALLSEVADHRLAPPDQTFEDRLVLPGSRGAELLSFGRGHTEADAVLFLPSEKILFSGDLAVVGMQPSLGSGDPHHWLLVLDQIERLGAERIVPGHGPVMPAEALRETREYLAGILTAVESPPGTALPSALRRWEGSVSLEENLKFARSLAAAGDGEN